MPDIRGLRFAVLAVVIAVMLVLPLVIKSSFALEILIRVLLFSFIGSAWNLMGGYAKQLSLGHGRRSTRLSTYTRSCAARRPASSGDPARRFRPFCGST